MVYTEVICIRPTTNIDSFTSHSIHGLTAATLPYLGKMQIAYTIMSLWTEVTHNCCINYFHLSSFITASVHNSPLFQPFWPEVPYDNDMVHNALVTEQVIPSVNQALSEISHVLIWHLRLTICHSCSVFRTERSKISANWRS